MTAIVKTTPKSLRQHNEENEKRIIEETLRLNKGVIGKTSEALGISRLTLWRKMRTYGIAVIKSDK